MTIFGVIVVISTADTPKLELRVSGKLKCESFETCEKCAQNNWGGITAQKQQILIILGGGYHSNGRCPRSETYIVWQNQLENA